MYIVEYHGIEYGQICSRASIRKFRIRYSGFHY